MKINVSIPKIMEKAILDRNHYVTEKITLYFSELDEDDGDTNKYRGVVSTVAYPEGERPEFLDDEFPLVDDCEDIMYDTVVEDLFNSWLMKVLLMHDPD